MCTRPKCHINPRILRATTQICVLAQHSSKLQMHPPRCKEQGTNICYGTADISVQWTDDAQWTRRTQGPITGLCDRRQVLGTGRYQCGHPQSAHEDDQVCKATQGN